MHQVELELIEASMDYAAELHEYLTEYEKEEIIGSSGLTPDSDISSWLVQIDKYKSWKTIPAGHIPGIQYLALDCSNHTVVGLLNLRLSLNETLLHYYGHIGYSVRPSRRHSGIGTKMLALGLEKAKNLGFNNLLLTCKEDNIVSAKIIEKNHGSLEDTRFNPDEGRWFRRYWIDLN